MFQQSDKYDVFISYETLTGTNYANHLKKALDKDGYNCFCADLSLEKGEEWEKKIDSALEGCKYFVVIITSLAVLRFKWAIKEYNRAKELGKRIIPCIQIDIYDLETLFLSYLQQIEFEEKDELATKVV